MDQQKVETLALRMVGDMAASFSMALGHIGDRLGLFRAMKDAGPVTSEQLAAKTRLNERYVREWLKAMVAAEYLDYDPVSAQYVMTAEQPDLLADDTSPMSAGGALQFTTPTVVTRKSSSVSFATAEAFRTRRSAPRYRRASRASLAPGT